MRRFTRRAGLGPLLLLAGLQACTSPGSRTTPLFVPDQTDAQRFQALARAQEAQLSTCAERRACDRAHFIRALAALYENRAVAAQHFRDVVAAAPDGPLASSSLLWLSVLKDASSNAGRTDPLARATEQLVRDLLDRELTIQQLTKEVDGAAIQALQRGLKTRDKQVEELTKQLEALKRIDQEMKEKEKARQKKSGNKIKPSPEKAPQP